jgi:hypothetical protein
MNQENTSKLVRRFPVLYQDFYSSMQQSAMCWGFDHGNGWNDIIWQLSLAIEEELGYSAVQKRWFLIKKGLAKQWNGFIYRLSPVVQDKQKMIGKGVAGDPMRWVVVEKVYPRDQWLKDLLVRILPNQEGDFKSTLGSFQRLGLKALVWHPNTGFSVSQVKEKFGTLRYYCPGSDSIYRFVNLAESLSEVTCELCGKMGATTESIHGWLSTVCDEHSRLNKVGVHS